MSTNPAAFDFPITPTQQEFVETVAVKTGLVTEHQYLSHWWLRHQPGIRNVHRWVNRQKLRCRRSLVPLLDRGLIERREISVLRPALHGPQYLGNYPPDAPPGRPRWRWARGEPAPNFETLARGRQLTLEFLREYPNQQKEVGYFATRRLVDALSPGPSRADLPTYTSDVDEHYPGDLAEYRIQLLRAHHLNLSELYLLLRNREPARARCWVHADPLGAATTRRVMTLPDVFLREDSGRPAVAITTGVTSYADAFRRFHEHCASHAVDYEAY